MKKYVFLTLALGAAVATQSMAQCKKGPAAKNCKVWKKKHAKTQLVTLTKESVTGPAAKNSKVWQEDNEAQAIVYVERQELKGPKAKNQRPFRKEEVELMAKR